MLFLQRSRRSLKTEQLLGLLQAGDVGVGVFPERERSLGTQSMVGRVHQRSRHYKFPRGFGRRLNDHLLHLSACEIQVFEASNRVWVANSLLPQDFRNAAKLRGCTNLDSIITLYPSHACSRQAGAIPRV
jgi:hypothetical protein